ncbi:Hypothetical predicted protein [Lecanosticta acicola]|uniref:Uncharacterized protein n=1 Tax=Lecanosticta acicola TaxID=111012 RepID=A0AAI8Z8P5_9PEZI|nr:Hypothetical predicted protein [Lecanosticta acicola]
MVSLRSFLATALPSLALTQEIASAISRDPTEANPISQSTSLLQIRDTIPGDETCKESCTNAITTALTLGPTYCTSNDFINILNTCLACTYEPQNAEIWTLYDIVGLGKPCGLIAQPATTALGQQWTTVSKMPDVGVPTGRPEGEMVVGSGRIAEVTGTSVASAGETGSVRKGLAIVGLAVGAMVL